jgi:hypothetical protein
MFFETNLASLTKFMKGSDNNLRKAFEILDQIWGYLSFYIKTDDFWRIQKAVPLGDLVIGLNENFSLSCFSGYTSNNVKLIRKCSFSSFEAHSSICMFIL